MGSIHMGNKLGFPRPPNLTFFGSFELMRLFVAKPGPRALCPRPRARALGPGLAPRAPAGTQGSREEHWPRKLRGAQGRPSALLLPSSGAAFRNRPGATTSPIASPWSASLDPAVARAPSPQNARNSKTKIKNKKR